MNKDSGEEREKIVYRVECNGLILALTAWAPETFFAVGEEIDVPVFVNTYVNRRGQPNYSLNLGGNILGGEEF